MLKFIVLCSQVLDVLLYIGCYGNAYCMFSGHCDPYLICYTENSVFVYDVYTADWVQTLCLKKVTWAYIYSTNNVCSLFMSTST